MLMSQKKWCRTTNMISGWVCLNLLNPSSKQVSPLKLPKNIYISCNGAWVIHKMKVLVNGR